jgi:N-acetylglucosaminyl-diphospho-decaprenol L-rhamnosyltransferase
VTGAAILVVTQDTRDDVLACLTSVEGQDRVDEILVLDNASEDGTAAAIRRHHPAVTVLEQAHRAGFGANNNTLIRASSAPYVYLLNPDTVSDPGSVATLAGYLDAHPSVAAVGPRLVYPDGRTQDSAWRFPTPATCWRAALTLARGGITQSGGPTARPVDWAMASALMLRRSAAEAVGLFDERYFMYSEETDLARRLAAAGFRVHWTPAARVVHHQGRSSAGVPERRLVEEWRGRHRYWRTHHSRLGARVAALGLAVQYTLLAVAGGVLLRLPPRLRPVDVPPNGPATWRRAARFALLGPRGPGLAELASGTTAPDRNAPPSGPRG